MSSVTIVECGPRITATNVETTATEICRLSRSKESNKKGEYGPAKNSQPNYEQYDNIQFGWGCCMVDPRLTPKRPKVALIDFERPFECIPKRCEVNVLYIFRW